MAYPFLDTLQNGLKGAPPTPTYKFKHLNKNDTLIGIGAVKFRAYTALKPYKVTVHFADNFHNSYYDYLYINGKSVDNTSEAPPQLVIETFNTLNFRYSGPSDAVAPVHVDIGTTVGTHDIGIVTAGNDVTYTVTSDTDIYIYLYTQLAPPPIPQNVTVYDYEGNVVELDPEQLSKSISVISYTVDKDQLTPEQLADLEEAEAVLAEVEGIEEFIPERADFIVRDLFYFSIAVDNDDGYAAAWHLSQGGSIEVEVDYDANNSLDYDLIKFEDGMWYLQFDDSTLRAVEILDNMNLKMTFTGQGIFALLST